MNAGCDDAERRGRRCGRHLDGRFSDRMAQYEVEGQRLSSENTRNALPSCGNEVGVDVTPLFWPADHVPALPHEYQFHLDYEDAQAALVETLEFLAGVTG
jgi:hypothetical protein